MSKPILYYVLTRHGLTRFSSGFGVLGVTSEKGRQVYGRGEDDAATHVSQRDVIYRFPPGTSLEYAKGATLRAATEHKKHEVGIQQAQAELSRLQDLRTQRTLEAAKGLIPDTTGAEGVKPWRERSDGQG